MPAGPVETREILSDLSALHHLNCTLLLVHLFRCSFHNSRFSDTQFSLQTNYFFQIIFGCFCFFWLLKPRVVWAGRVGGRRGENQIFLKKTRITCGCLLPL